MIARIVYKPFSIVLGWIAARIAGKAFQSTWERRHGTKPPSPTTEDATWGQVVGSAALRAATFAATVAVLDRLAQGPSVASPASGLVTSNRSPPRGSWPLATEGETGWHWGQGGG